VLEDPGGILRYGSVRRRCTMPCGTPIPL
jgi:hypothetical protein